MTPADWKRFEAGLAFPGDRVELRCDGDQVVGVVERVKALTYGIVVYVNGQWRGEWFNASKSFPEQRFMNLRSQSLHTAAELKLYSKLYSAKQVRDLKAKRLTWYSPEFASATAWRRRLVSQCKVIELVSTGLPALGLSEHSLQAARMQPWHHSPVDKPPTPPGAHA